MNFNVGFRTDIGQKRQQNQDSGVHHPHLGLFVVADGMGGHRGGEIASSMATKTITESVTENTKSTTQTPESTIHTAIQAANNNIYKYAHDNPELQGMGTTTVALYFTGANHLTIGHVGDSRCYFLNPTGIWQLTRDHSIVQEKLRAGLITREQLKTDQMKNVITRSVGFEPTLAIDIYQMAVKSGDTFLICSDGLTGMVDDATILEIAQRNLFTENPDTQRVADFLITTANANGGDDNITVCIIQIA